MDIFCLEFRGLRSEKCERGKALDALSFALKETYNNRKLAKRYIYIYICMYVYDVTHYLLPIRYSLVKYYCFIYINYLINNKIQLIDKRDYLPL